MNKEAAKSISGVCSSLSAGGYSVKLRGFSALDLYFGLPALPCIWVQTNADITALARFFENLRFPGVEIADGAVDTSDGTCYFRCLDGEEHRKSNYSFPLLSFFYDWQTRRFEDPLGVYPQLKELRSKKGILLEDGLNQTLPFNFNSLFDCGGYVEETYSVIMIEAMFLARYGIGTKTLRYSPGPPPIPEMQRAFLCCLMASHRPDLGLEFLKHSGFLDELWPELASLDNVDHSKEFHPEGNVWNHTLETFRYRKSAASGVFDLRLSLGLLLHDVGKPVSASFGSRRFDGHAELGAQAAVRFLERLEFEPPLIQDVFYLVKNHMLPAALKRLPLAKTKEIMASPLFPTLMELYRCDESSSFKGLDDYYENSAVYQAYRKNVKNPYRSADGKKIGKRELYISYRK